MGSASCRKKMCPSRECGAPAKSAMSFAKAQSCLTASAKKCAHRKCENIVNKITATLSKKRQSTACGKPTDGQSFSRGVGRSVTRRDGRSVWSARSRISPQLHAG